MNAPQPPPSAHHAAHPDRAPRLLRWLGFGRHAEVGAPCDPLPAARQEVLAGITRFLIAHDLEISDITLSLAHLYATRADGRLCRMIDARIEAGEPLTPEWLLCARRETFGANENDAVDEMMAHLAGNLDEFSRTTQAAKIAAKDYKSALASHVDELINPQQMSGLLGELAGLASAMLDRTRALEKDMARSELQTKALSRSLSDARRSAEEDQLTGLPNRRAFEAHFASEYDEARLTGEPLCVAFCDVDHFKAINDRHGHEAGDRVLRSIAQSLARVAHNGCHVARHGGEEFVVLLRGYALDQACSLLETARSQQAERRLVNRANDLPFGKVTFSAGVADVYAHADARSALRAADEALFRAKSEGRNRIVVAPDSRIAEARAA